METKIDISIENQNKKLITSKKIIIENSFELLIEDLKYKFIIENHKLNQELINSKKNDSTLELNITIPDLNKPIIITPIYLGIINDNKITVEFIITGGFFKNNKKIIDLAIYKEMIL